MVKKYRLSIFILIGCGLIFSSAFLFYHQSMHDYETSVEKLNLYKKNLLNQENYLASVRSTNHFFSYLQKKYFFVKPNLQQGALFLEKSLINKKVNIINLQLFPPISTPFKNGIIHMQVRFFIDGVFEDLQAWMSTVKKDFPGVITLKCTKEMPINEGMYAHIEGVWHVLGCNQILLSLDSTSLA